jgi:hypothetical protein
VLAGPIRFAEVWLAAQSRTWFPPASHPHVALDQAKLAARTLLSLEITMATAIYEAIGQPVANNEMAWIVDIRDASGDTDPRLTSREGAAIRGMFGK